MAILLLIMMMFMIYVYALILDTEIRDLRKRIDVLEKK